MKEAEIRPHDLFDRYLALCRADIDRFFSDRTRFVDVPCPGCGTDRATPAFEKLGFPYVTCGECGSLYAAPRPTDEALRTYYREGESIRYWSSDFYRVTAEARRERMFRPRAQLVSELRQRFPEVSAVLVDVGCGYGIFLEEVRALGSFDRIVGVEPGPDLARVARERGFPVIEKMVEDVGAEECQAGLATAFEVIEHVFEPVRFLSAIRGVLRPGGLALVTTLTSDGFDIQVLWERSKSVYPPHHINLLSVEGARRLLRRAGLDEIEVTTPGQLDVDIVANMVTQDQVAVPRFVDRLLGSGDVARGAFQRYLSENRLSSHLRLIARS